MPEKRLHVTLIAHTPEAEKVIAMASRTCYSAKDLAQLKELAQSRDNAPYLRGVLESGHTSVIEHASFTFGIEGVSDERGDMFTFKPGDKWSGGAEGALLQIMIYSPEAQDAEFIATAPDEDGDPEEFSHTVRLDPCDGWRKLTLRSEDFKSPGAVCPEWPSIVSLGVRSASPVVIASMLWV